VASGAHAGGEATIRRTIELARAHGRAVGAHPGYPDREGFGRRALAIGSAELRSSILDQVRLVQSIARELGEPLVHVKPHGALYNDAARDEDLAELVAGAVHEVSPDLILVGLAGSHSLLAARAALLPVAAEAFADRAYEADGNLVSRRKPGAMVTDPAVAAARMRRLVAEGKLETVDGQDLPLEVDSICVHADTPGALAIVRAVREALEADGVAIRPLREIVPSR
jgi:UPF0271 protein